MIHVTIIYELLLGLSAIDLNGLHSLRDVNSFLSAKFEEKIELSIENKI